MDAAMKVGYKKCKSMLTPFVSFDLTMYDSSFSELKVSINLLLKPSLQTKLKEAGKFGRTHTCYFQTKVYTENPVQDEPVKQKKADKKGSKNQAQPAEDDLPY